MKTAKQNFVLCQKSWRFEGKQPWLARIDFLHLQDMNMLIYRNVHVRQSNFVWYPYIPNTNIRQRYSVIYSCSKVEQKRMKVCSITFIFITTETLKLKYYAYLLD